MYTISRGKRVGKLIINKTDRAMGARTMTRSRTCSARKHEREHRAGSGKFYDQLSMRWARVAIFIWDWETTRAAVEISEK